MYTYKKLNKEFQGRICENLTVTFPKKKITNLFDIKTNFLILKIEKCKFSSHFFIF